MESPQIPTFLEQVHSAMLLSSRSGQSVPLRLVLLIPIGAAFASARLALLGSGFGWPECRKISLLGLHAPSDESKWKPQPAPDRVGGGRRRRRRRSPLTRSETRVTH